MPSSPPTRDPDALLRRVEALEKSNARLQRALAGFAALGMLAVGAAFMQPRARSLEAERLVLRDARGAGAVLAMSAGTMRIDLRGGRDSAAFSFWGQPPLAAPAFGARPSATTRERPHLLMLDATGEEIVRLGGPTVRRRTPTD